MAKTSGKDSLYRRIYTAVARVPRGRVVTYGQVARGVRGATPRVVGYAMAALPDRSSVPWHRVVNHRGGISLRSGGDGACVQRALLEAEGVRFRDNGCMDLERYRWLGRSRKGN
ncbi:MAG TPA: MGMT family protein [Dongiaceae bacterium]|jgi:methylated-DNA-protein-cysteine methyltransferase-like protein|nr:MGMT family protein [Dongiaceae bacterium]